MASKKSVQEAIEVLISVGCQMSNIGKYYGYGAKDLWVPIDSLGGMATKAFHSHTVRFPTRIDKALRTMLERKRRSGVLMAESSRKPHKVDFPFDKRPEARLLAMAKYIASSPSEEYGGFKPNVIAEAKAALASYDEAILKRRRVAKESSK